MGAISTHPDTASPRAAPHSRRDTTRLVLAASIGNALEWFDLTAYGYFAVQISKEFFPSGSDAVSLLLAFGTFGVSYLVRPVGAIVLGAYADKAGRKASLLVSIMLMMVGTFMMAFWPNYNAIGLAAPIGILCARLMQGFSVGGEFGSSTAFLVEHDASRKGFLSSFQFSSQGVSNLLGSLFGLVLSVSLSAGDLQAWGWRIPFLFGLLIGPVGLYIRKRIDETPEFVETKAVRAPAKELLASHKFDLLLAIGAVTLSTATNYLIVYMPTYAVKSLGLPQSIGFLAAVVAALVLTLVAPLTGHWSDKVGRIRIMLFVAIAALFTILPTFMLLNGYPTAAMMIAALAWIAIIKAGYAGALPALMAEIFPTQIRGTGMSLAYNVAVTVFGGFSPFINSSLIQLTGSNLSPAFYIMMIAVLTIATLVVLRRRGVAS
jgi:MHS family proline/betaine transporter-like MFS transporter